MLLRALLNAATVRGEMDRAALAVHSTMLEHGFVCVGVAEPAAAPDAAVAAGADGSVNLQLLPPGWNATADSYTFAYAHPLRGAAETFTVKALAINDSLAVHAASSTPGADLLTVTITVARDAADTAAAAVLARAQEWQERVTSGIALKLLARQNSTKRLGAGLEQAAEAGRSASSSGGTKRPAPEEERSRRDEEERRRRDEDADMLRPPQPGFFPGMRDPFSPGFFGDDVRPPLLWTPDAGNLLGPRHPAWGQVVPGHRGGGMMIPRFDPIGPGGGEPDPDHLRVPGHTPESFPAFQGGASGRRGGGFDPFIL